MLCVLLLLPHCFFHRQGKSHPLSEAWTCIIYAAAHVSVILSWLGWLRSGMTRPEKFLPLWSIIQSPNAGPSLPAVMLSCSALGCIPQGRGWWTGGKLLERRQQRHCMVEMFTSLQVVTQHGWAGIPLFMFTFNSQTERDDPLLGKLSLWVGSGRWQWEWLS